MKPTFFLTTILWLITASFSTASTLTPGYLRTEYKENPFTDVGSPRLSWELKGDGYALAQTAYEILVATSADKLTPSKADLWYSGIVPGDKTSQIPYQGKTLTSRQKCFWKVRSYDQKGNPGPWSKIAFWEMALLHQTEWKADWIGLDLDHLGKGPVYHLPPAPYLRKEIKLDKPVKKARLYVTALGLYEFSINGKKVGDDRFTPGWTDYDKRLYYQVYDVTNNLKTGQNALASQISYGWYAGYLGYALLVKNPVVRGFYGKVPVLKAQLEVEYSDGSTELVTTGNDWKANYGPLVESDILNGETYDARKEWPNWNKAGFNDKEWMKPQVFPDKAERILSVYPGPPVKVTQTLHPKSVTKRPDGTYIFDLGQNFAGTVRIRVKGQAGDSIRLRFGEKLHPDGRLMTENLRMARATDTYILKGKNEFEVWEPQFTFHGFQYVEVAGLKSQPTTQQLTGLVIGSDTPKTGHFETDNPMINQLYSNIDWTQRANYLEVPTDCPQRDERMGWTADAQVYAKSAMFNRDVASFFTKWVVDLEDSQRPEGAYPLYSPSPNVRKSDSFSPGWMEAGIICPYETYQAYGDTRIISNSWPYMVKFMDFLSKRSHGTFVFKEKTFHDISPKGGFGDWLSFGKKTSPDLLASFYYAHCADLMAEMAGALGKKEDEEKYKKVGQLVRAAITDHYYDNSSKKFAVDAAAYGDGKGYVDGQLGFTGHTQTTYANAIYMDLLSSADKQAAGQYLVDLISENNGKLATGFLGAKALLPALSATGHSDLAYQLFLSKEFPSWGFEVMNGSTSIWERWDSYTIEDGFKYNASMNSFSHYAFGAVCEWMFGNVAGIKNAAPGFKKVIFKPEIPKEGINRLNATYRTPHGLIRSSWKKSDNSLQFSITVPVNTTASIVVPSFGKNQVRLLQGKNAPAFTHKGMEDGRNVYETGSGTYVFEIR